MSFGLKNNISRVLQKIRAMKKIMFNDKYGSTGAVLTGRKTMTQRIIPQLMSDKDFDLTNEMLKQSK